MKKTLAHELVVIGLVALVAISGLSLQGCSGCHQEPEAVPTAAAPAQPASEPAKAPEPPAATLPPAAEGPDTCSLLQLAPENTTLSLAFPSVNSASAKLTTLAKRFYTAEEVDARIAAEVTEKGAEWGIADAKTLADLANGKGLNPDKPLAAFVDFSPIGKEGAPADAEPAYAVAAYCDPAVAVKALEEVAKNDNLKKKEDIKVEGVDIHVFTPDEAKYLVKGPNEAFYFVVDNVVVFGNSVDFAKGVVQRLKNPAKLRYGTAECPAGAPDEVAALVRSDILIPLLPKVVPVLAKTVPQLQGLENTQVQNMSGMLTAYQGEDPMVITAQLDDSKFELSKRIDNATHPSIKTVYGEAKPLRLASYLPENIQFMFSICLTEEMKNQLKESLKAMPADVTQGPKFGQMSSILNQVLQIIGNEVTIGIGGAETGLPELFIMVALSNPEQNKNLLKMLIPATAGETYSDVAISKIAIPGQIPIPVHIAMPGDAVVLSNNPERLKPIIDAVKNATPTPLFAQLSPTLDPAKPRFGAILLKPELLPNSLLPILTLLGQAPDGAAEKSEPLVKNIKEFRMISEDNGTWSEGKFTIQFR